MGQNQKPTVAVDLDGVLATYDGWKGLDHIGAARPGAVPFMAALRKDYYVMVHSSRACHDNARHEAGETEESLRGRIEAWLRKHNIEFDAVWSGHGKPIALAYLDDRAVMIPSNPLAPDFAVARTRIDQLAARNHGKDGQVAD